PRAGCGRSACPVRRAGCGNGATVELVRHRQTKEAATDRFYLQPPRHISTLPERTSGPGAQHMSASRQQPTFEEARRFDLSLAYPPRLYPTRLAYGVRQAVSDRD